MKLYELLMVCGYVALCGLAGAYLPALLDSPDRNPLPRHHCAK